MRIYQCSNCYYEIDFQTYLERGGLCPICDHIINPTNCYETEPLRPIKLSPKLRLMMLKECDINVKTSES